MFGTNLNLLGIQGDEGNHNEKKRKKDLKSIPIFFREHLRSQQGIKHSKINLQQNKYADCSLTIEGTTSRFF
jgi:hypothetical protein